ncbi:OprO/OprP family phosphate-selective porin [Salinicola sp. CPA57]|uniref:OprO/OprP family phosphate-selective porin n=1 Tax=Salinicola sp. CPA57 TaxID=1949080 RepID=UPI001E349868|nr:OprO/OprP family phosphate-selective porin [Salinicola sp. CPA57]
MNKLKPLSIAAQAAISLMLAANAHAVEMSDTFQVHGFMSQALIVTDHNDFFGPSSEKGGSLEYTELGLNASVRPLSNVLVAGQVLSRKAGNYGDAWQPKLDYGVVDYQVIGDEKRALGVQLGRFKNPFGFYNQTRDAPSTRPSILLPQSIYFDRSRSLGLASDGLSVYDEERLSNGTVYIQGGVGIPQINGDAEISLSPSNPSLNGKVSTIGQVLYSHDGGRINVALSMAQVRSDYQSRQDRQASGEFVFQPTVVSFQYNAEKWSLTAEYEYQKRELKGFQISSYNGRADGESAYLQYLYRLSNNWQWLLRYDYAVSNRNDRDGKRYEASGRGPDYSRFAKDITSGLQWRVTPDWNVQAEFHHVNGTAWLPRQDNDDEKTEQYWNMLLLQTSFSF